MPEWVHGRIWQAEEERLEQPMLTRVAVVSGGGTGMGKAVAARLVADGCHVVITGRRSEVLEATAGELSEAASGAVSWHAADLTRPPGCVGPGPWQCRCCWSAF